MEGRIGAKVFVRGDEVGEKYVLAITDKTWLTDGGEEVGGERDMEEVLEMGLQKKVGQERLLGLTVARCAGDLRLEV